MNYMSENIYKENEFPIYWYNNSKYRFGEPIKLIKFCFKVVFSGTTLFFSFFFILTYLSHPQLFDILFNDFLDFTIVIIGMVIIMAFCSILLYLSYTFNMHRENPILIKRIGISKNDLLLEFNQSKSIVIPMKMIISVNNTKLKYMDNSQIKSIYYGYYLDKKIYKTLKEFLNGK